MLFCIHINFDKIRLKTKQLKGKFLNKNMSLPLSNFPFNEILRFYVSIYIDFY